MYFFDYEEFVKSDVPVLSSPYSLVFVAIRHFCVCMRCF